MEAAVKVLTYKYTMDEELKGDVSILEAAREDLKESLELYRKLAELTDKTYLYANSMQTPQRKIPFPNGETYGHWMQCLPEYEKEYAAFDKHVEEMKTGIFPKEEEPDENIEPLKSAEFTLLCKNCETFRMEKGASVFTDYTSPIQTLAPEINGLTGIRFGLGEAIEAGVKVKVELKEDSLILEFMQSEYYHIYQELLENERLGKMLEKYNCCAVFYPHYEIQKFIDVFHTASARIQMGHLGKADVQTLLRESSILVTDFSSAQFDFAYMKKPVIYYQFDQEKYYAGHYAKGYFEKDGFGPVVQTIEELLEQLNNVMENQQTMTEQYQKRVDAFFGTVDDQNCERTFQAIQKLRKERLDGKR